MKDKPSELVYMTKEQKLAEALHIMRQQSISQIPVRENGEIIGSLTESRVLNAVLDDPALKEAAVSSVMSDPLPFGFAFHTDRNCIQIDQ